MRSLLKFLGLFVLLSLAGCSDDTSATSLDTATDPTNDGDVDATQDTAPDLADDGPSDVGAEPDAVPDLEPDGSVDADSDLAADSDDDPDQSSDLSDDASADSADDTDATDLVDSADADPCAPKPSIDDSVPYVLVGVGFGEYGAVDNCDDVPIVLGIQGGAHIWGAFQAGGFDAETNEFFHIDFEFEQGDEVVASANYIDTVRFVDEPMGGPYFYDSVTVILDEDLVPEDRLDIPGVLRLHLWREDSVDLRDEVILIPNEVTF